MGWDRVVFGLCLTWFLAVGVAGAEGVYLSPMDRVHVRVKVQPWKALRDAEVVKQDLDFSCGAASMATLLNGFYGQSLDEKTLLVAMDKEDARASFADMQRVLPRFGFKAQGFAASYEQLSKLKMPVIVYLKHRKDDHFSVLKGINDRTVWLADSSLGNRTYSKEQFLDMWQTREETELSGKFLAILPLKDATQKSMDFFEPNPQRKTEFIKEHLAIRHVW